MIIVDKVDFPVDSDTALKRSILEPREGYWQTQLRTLRRYRGLNIKDERKNCNTRKACALTRKANVPSATSPSLETSQGSVDEVPDKNLASQSASSESEADEQPDWSSSSSSGAEAAPVILRRSSRLANKNPRSYVYDED